MNEDFDIREEQYLSSKEKDFENALRPLRFADFSGQTKVVENLSIFVEAAKFRGEPLDHTLLHGPPGLGKTTLSNIIARTTCCSSTRYTASRPWSRSTSTRLWRTIASTS